MYTSPGAIVRAGKTALLSTLEPLTFPVDYNDGTAVDPFDTIIFTTQAEIDDFLLAQGASNFKHVVAVWNALPFLIRHVVTINMAAGVHRPRSTEIGSDAFPFNGKLIDDADAYVNIIGALPSSWDVVVASQTITAVQTASSDPYVDVSGTPYTGLNLQGYWALFNTGQVAVIHEHTVSRLNVIQKISPTGPVSVTVVKPSTIFRNSLDDVNRFKSSSAIYLNSNVSVAGDSIWIFNARVDHFGSTWGVLAGSGGYLSEALIDCAYQSNQYGSAKAAGRPLQTRAGTSLYVAGSSIRGSRMATIPSNSTTVAFYIADGAAGKSRSSGYLSNVFIKGCANGLQVSGMASLNNVIIDDILDVLWGAIRMQNGWLAFQDIVPSYLGAKPLTIRNCALGLTMRDSEIAIAQYLQMAFENITGPCVRVDELSRVITNTTNSVGFINGIAGGNLDVGIEYASAFGARGDLAPGTNVSGANGDVRFGGVISTYANLVATGPFTDTAFNYLRKLT